MTRIHCFSIPALHPEPAQSELNAFLSHERVLALRREFIPDGAYSYWAFCVELASGPAPLPDELKVPGARGSQPAGPRDRPDAVDYKQRLSEADFAVFAKLRNLRKQLAQADGVPVYAVFSNEQLANIVTRRVDSLTALAALEGVGPARLDKYGSAVLEFMSVNAGPLPSDPDGP